MQVILYCLLIFVSIILLVILYNRLYFEINLAHGMKKLNKQLKSAMNEEVNAFKKELKDTLNLTIDAMTESYEELAKSLNDMKQRNK